MKKVMFLAAIGATCFVQSALAINIQNNLCPSMTASKAPCVAMAPVDDPAISKHVTIHFAGVGVSMPFIQEGDRSISVKKVSQLGDITYSTNAGDQGVLLSNADLEKALAPGQLSAHAIIKLVAYSHGCDSSNPIKHISLQNQYEVCVSYAS